MDDGARAPGPAGRAAVSRWSVAAVVSSVLVAVAAVLLARTSPTAATSCAVGAGVLAGVASLVKTGVRGARTRWDGAAVHGGLVLLLAVGLVALYGGTLGGPLLQLGEVPKTNAATDLGNALVGGIIVSLVLLLLEERRRERERGAAVQQRAWDERLAVVSLLATAADLRRRDLSDLDLSFHGVRGRDLSGARLRRVCCFRTNLEGSDLSEVEADDACWVNAFAADADLRGARLPRAVLDHADLRGADLRSAVLAGASLRHAVLDGARLEGADLRGADLRAASLAGARWEGAVVDDETLFSGPVDAAGLPVRRAAEGERREPFAVPTGALRCGAAHDHHRERVRQEQRSARARHRERLEARTPA